MLHLQPLYNSCYVGYYNSVISVFATSRGSRRLDFECVQVGTLITYGVQKFPPCLGCMTVQGNIAP